MIKKSYVARYIVNLLQKKPCSMCSSWVNKNWNKLKSLPLRLNGYKYLNLICYAHSIILKFFLHISISLYFGYVEASYFISDRKM